MLYFNSPYTEENIKQQYKKLAKILHPDKGGTDAKFKAMNEEKEIILNFLKLQKKSPGPKVKKEKITVIKRNTYIKIIRIDPEEIINTILDRIL